MQGLIQRVKHAKVEVDGQVIGQIEQGLLLLLGVEKHDDQQSTDKLLHKVSNYRVFSDENDKMNLSLQDIQGELLVVSQFTLAADTKKGMRPSFSSAATPAQANELYEYFVSQARVMGLSVATGQFAADMQVSLCNDGPVTFNLTV
ncbi:MAG: D-tyrosyl-tRNA(Tyr) deacylase [Pseudoalteromonas rhizosphaerae]|jgi:D-tyrosyl-tRNA(Tyr) deacylase|uniref:D-aminoacyl-tRNA deacylase n=1 Tax=Pseudoalteromonas TaxID=53246 RepID=UPI0015FF525B|nr:MULTISPECIES: D-aminoacyl-tRNA deacylase [Pseudoalteromonas]MBB1303226.1 D-tyrosyl-tRNA(Tyr) deacylase [Pseudoalteromonas sp. SR44-8]MBB1310260.1 D-tyrosyl-tRNA(Tyr) deacylase [Pseudoalteromonas sp. SR41-8]MBB1399541.1 D-tyrosyl-tRNA(Tyr) deacylase [Pseudoalteromonas sp. SG44-8]MBB1409964.1 D-tyrosyl-tRNA(Tyr) deacylase [Pseudoalteromonas sp. SG44-17]MBB1468681.1 D-tyrosyl-tRNA(Tyr) deacylase [Pseudoalteromonas sp. SG41-5]|tara:strand:- start:2898 stop:3335 length:438 start_codon:yes stop_codon:yes gene_type:complete